LRGETGLRRRPLAGLRRRGDEETTRYRDAGKKGNDRRAPHRSAACLDVEVAGEHAGRAELFDCLRDGIVAVHAVVDSLVDGVVEVIVDLRHDALTFAPSDAESC